MDDYIIVDALPITQNERDFYIFKIKANDLLDIAYVNTREIDRETGIQRPFKELRSKEIAEYIDSENSTLPNNIIINLRSQYITVSNGKLTIKRVKDTAFIIDGQHRIKAFQYTIKKDFELPISAFIDLSLSEIAEIFVKINYYQKSVNKSLVYDLLSISKDIFPEYTVYLEAHNITKILDETIGSPWFGLIRMLGIGKGIITQATFITALEENKILNYVLKDFDTKEKTIILSNYFEAIKKLLPEQWGHRGSIISKSVGLHALIRVFPKVFNTIVEKTNGFKIEIIKEFISDIKNIPFNSDEIASLGGKKGVGILAQKIERLIFK